jgi:hypothetical protein
MSLTSGPSHAETATRTCVRDHYGAVTEGPRRPVTSTPHVAHNVCAVSPEKARPLRTTAAMTVDIYPHAI